MGKLKDKITVVTHERKKHSTHRDSFENLETEEDIHEAEDKVCPECGSEMEVIGKEFVRDELVYIPARMFVRKHYVETIRCVSCGFDKSRNNENTENIPKSGAQLVRYIQICDDAILYTYYRASALSVNILSTVRKFYTLVIHTYKQCIFKVKKAVIYIRCYFEKLTCFHSMFFYVTFILKGKNKRTTDYIKSLSI